MRGIAAAALLLVVAFAFGGPSTEGNAGTASAARYSATADAHDYHGFGEDAHDYHSHDYHGADEDAHDYHAVNGAAATTAGAMAGQRKR